MVAGPGPRPDCPWRIGVRRRRGHGVFGAANLAGALDDLAEVSALCVPGRLHRGDEDAATARARVREKRGRGPAQPSRSSRTNPNQNRVNTVGARRARRVTRSRVLRRGRPCSTATASARCWLELCRRIISDETRARPTPAARRVGLRSFSLWRAAGPAARRPPSPSRMRLHLHLWEARRHRPPLSVGCERAATRTNNRL